MATEPVPKQIPIFPSSNFDGTVAFYEKLGFVEENRFGSNYLIIEHPAGLELHFYGAGKVKTRSNDHAGYIRFDAAEPVEALHSAWAEAAADPTFGDVAGKAGRVLGLTDTDYGLKEFAVLDVDGNLLRVGGVTGDVVQ